MMFCMLVRLSGGDVCSWWCYFVTFESTSFFFLGISYVVIVDAVAIVL